MSNALAMLLLILPPNEASILARVAAKYKLTMEQTALLGAIRRAEAGSCGKELGVEVPRAQRYSHSPSRSLYVQGCWAAATIKKRYTGDVDAFARRWTPVNPVVEAKNLRFFMQKQGY